jgi:hypothetical protein
MWMEYSGRGISIRYGNFSLMKPHSIGSSAAMLVPNLLPVYVGANVTNTLLRLADVTHPLNDVTRSSDLATIAARVPIPIKTTVFNFKNSILF